MALFKILKGPEKKDAAGKSVMLDPTASGLGIHEGWAYITEEGNFYVDFSKNKRLHINAHSITSDFATNDSNGDKICETYIGEIKYMIKSETPYLQYYFGGPDDRISATPVAMPVASISSGGVVSTGAQSFKGTKTFTNDIVIQHSTVDNMTQTSTNPFLKFSNSDGSQNVMIMFTDYDSYRSPAGLKILGTKTSTTSASPAWLEVEGDFIVGGATTLNGGLTIKGNLLPATNNTYTLGSDTYKWKSLYTTTAYINETIYINKSQDGGKGGISLYGTSAPTSYGIAMRSKLGTHGYATDDWNTYFSMTGGDQRGWIFRNENDSAVASINGQGYAQLNKLCLNRKGNKAYGRISWFSSTYKTWHDYMSSNGSGECPSGGTPSSLGAVKTWALRSYIENSNGYGWLWESAAEENTGTPTPRMALSSYDGKLYLSNDLNIIVKDTDKFVHYLYDSTATDYIGASWRAGVLGSGTGNANYYVIQSGTSTTSPAPTTWNNAVRIGQNEYDFTVGTSTKGSIGIANTTSTTGNGISLYGGAAIGKPTYGLFFGGTNSFGKHGGVQGDWATYFTMDSGTNRGWIFLRGDTAVASISNTGVTKIGNSTDATDVDTGALRIAGGLSTTHKSYFGDTIIMSPPSQMMRWTASATDNNPTGRNWYGIGTYTNTSDNSNWLNISNYWGINITTMGNTYLRHNNYIIPHTNNQTGTVGSTSQPVYINSGVVTAITGTLANSISGNAATATKLQTTRNIILNGNLQGSASFNGTRDATITALNYQSSVSGGNTYNYPWHRIATTVVGTGQFNDKSALLRIRHTFNGGGEGLVKVSVRTNSTGSGCDISAIWLYRYNIAANSIGIGLWGVTGDNVYLDVYYKCVGGWPRGIVESISNGRIFTLISSNEANDTTTTDKKTSSEVYTSIENGATLIRGKAYTKIVYGSDGVDNGRYVLKTGDTMTGHLNNNSEFITTSQNGFRISAASSTSTKSMLLRNDGSNFYILCCNSAAAGDNWYIPTGGAHPFRIDLTTGYSYFSRAYGAVWNDYAEYRSTSQVKPGQCVIETGLGDLVQSTERLQPGANIVSDTFGFAIGETEQTKTPLAVSGRVLAYPYEDRYSYLAGDPVCSGPNGTISKMTREEVRKYPDRIVGTVSEIPEYETWGTGNVKVNGRIWIKVR